MNESPIYSRTYDFVAWLLPQAIKFPRAYRFTLAERVQRRALDFQETLVAAGLERGNWRAVRLREADTQLAQLRQTLRLCQELGLLTLRQYEHAAERLAEIGRLLGGWQKKLEATGSADGARRRVEQQSQELPRRLPEQEPPDEL
ncbi:MAG: diversity-generating retroelement protein Avd [Candidatus Rokubacteria bacterium]|nr:diversity-generating retroelement protein Avd [Candidatus Rokubacteria bacterium]